MLEDFCNNRLEIFYLVFPNKLFAILGAYTSISFGLRMKYISLYITDISYYIGYIFVFEKIS